MGSWYGVTTDDEGRVIELHLAENLLSGQIPTELGNLSNLTGSVDLWGNQLTGTIPSEIGNLSNLTGMSLGGNELTGAIPTGTWRSLQPRRAVARRERVYRDNTNRVGQSRQPEGTAPGR